MTMKKPDEIFQWLTQQLREGAEAQLERADRSSLPTVHEDKLLHELRVHQIELEMQNEELRRAQLALGESRDRYIDLYEFAPVGYITLKHSGIITDANLRAANLLGMERVRLINRHFSHYTSLEDRERWHQYFLLAKQQATNQIIELTLCREDGTFFYAHLDCLSTQEANDFPTLRLTISDITERRQMQEALREQEIRLALALESAELSAWDWDITTGQCIYDERWAEISGYPLEEIGGHIGFWEQKIIYEDAALVKNALNEHFDGYLPLFVAEYRIRNKAEELVWIMDRGKVVQRDSEGKALRMTGVAMDITQRKQIEQQLRIAAAAFDTQAGIIITDAHKIIISANQAFTTITGYPAEEVIGQPPFILRSRVHDVNFYTNIWTSVANVGYWEGEMWNKRKNGQLFPTWCTIARVIDSNGFITHYVASLTDISVQKQAEQVLLDARHRLENQVASMQEELNKIREESLKINGTLDILLKYRETDKNQAQDALSREVESTILPFLKRLKVANTNRNQARLLEIIEANLLRLVSCYGRDNSLSSIYQKLTPSEVQVASLIRQGLPTKLIAATLHLSTGTVCIHRKHIRQKLGLNGSDDNLYGYLLSLAE